MQCATSNRVLTSEILTVAQLLSQSGMEIMTKKSDHIKPPLGVSIKAIQLQEGDLSKTAVIGAGLEDK